MHYLLPVEVSDSQPDWPTSPPPPQSIWKCAVFDEEIIWEAHWHLIAHGQECYVALKRLNCPIPHAQGIVPLSDKALSMPTVSAWP